MFKFPVGNAEFWRLKIERNVARDHRDREALLTAGWRVLTVWECSLRGKTQLGILQVAAECGRWLPSQEVEGVIAGGSKS